VGHVNTTPTRNCHTEQRFMRTLHIALPGFVVSSIVPRHRENHLGAITPIGQAL
jgi:hypothetical protein